MIETIIQAQGILEIVHPNMSEVNTKDPVAFTMLRRGGLGASDASTYLGVNLYTTLDELIAEKRSIEYTEREREIGEKETVRKGRDLEPLILQKFSEKFNIEVAKPTPMYRIKEHPYLTINFDGVSMFGDQPIPVEAKWVSAYGDKYWDKSKAIETLFEGSIKQGYNENMINHITEQANLYGVPPYYYTQIQQQMLGLNASFGYFAVIFDKGWKFCAFKIFRDMWVQKAIVNEGAIVWNMIKAPH